MMRRLSSIFALSMGLLTLACGKPNEAKIITTNPGGGELPASGNYATEVLSLDATERNHYQIYQVNPKLYGTSGAFNKIKGRLDEIKSFGTDILYLMPVYEEGKKDAIGSPYCIKDFKAVNTTYGTKAELKALVDAAHDKGMLVMFDWVANHTSWDNAWITEHEDWYEHKSNGSIAWPTKDGEWKDVAQLNYANKDLWDGMTDALKYWVTEMDIDGYRCDYAHGVRDDYWKDAIAKLRELKPGFIMLAESDYEKMFSDGFDIIFDRAMKSRMISLFSNLKVADFFSWYKDDQGKAPAPKSKLFFVTNHDDATTDTPAGQFKSLDGGLAAYVLMAALNGSSMIYGSQEAGNNKTINFFNTQTFNWDANQAFTKKFKDAMSALGKVHRDGKMKAYYSGNVVFVLYSDCKSGKGSLTAVNVGGTAVDADFPQPVAGKAGIPSRQNFGAYQFQIWETE